MQSADRHRFVVVHRDRVQGMRNSPAKTFPVCEIRAVRIFAVSMQSLQHWFRRHREIGPLSLRLFVGFVLVYGVLDNVLSWDRMLEFRGFLEANGFPFPLISAHLSVYAQLVAGVLIFLGLWTRIAAAVMVVNFIVALLMVHVGLPFSENIAPLAMLFGSLFLVFYGAPRYSLGAWLANRAEDSETIA